MLRAAVNVALRMVTCVELPLRNRIDSLIELVLSELFGRTILQCSMRMHEIVIREPPAMPSI